MRFNSTGFSLHSSGQDSTFYRFFEQINFMIIIALSVYT